MKLFGYWIIKDSDMQRHFAAGEAYIRLMEARRWFHPYKHFDALFQFLFTGKSQIGNVRQETLMKLGIIE